MVLKKAVLKKASPSKKTLSSKQVTKKQHKTVKKVKSTKAAAKPKKALSMKGKAKLVKVAMPQPGKEYLRKLFNDANDRLDTMPSPVQLGRAIVRGYDMNQGVNYNKMFATMSNTGFQATNLGNAIDRINEMIKWRLSDEKITADTPAHLRSKEVRENTRCTIFLGYTSNMSSCGMREYIKYLCQHKMVDCLVTTCGGIEEDFMKCLSNFYVGNFHLSGKKLHDQGIYRTGNLLVSSHSYTLF
jgi:Deoxyhypusine synthase